MSQVETVKAFGNTAMADAVTMHVGKAIVKLQQDEKLAEQYRRPFQFEIHSIAPIGEKWNSKMRPLRDIVRHRLELMHLGKYRRSRSNKALQSGPATSGTTLVQLFMTDPHTICVSVGQISRTPFYWNWPVPWAAGKRAVPEMPDAPAQSYAKCLELLANMNIDHTTGLLGKRVVELGSSPGGWTTVLLQAGAKVTSVDWAELKHPPLIENPRLTHLTTDALAFNPVENGLITLEHPQLDYLFADLACPPEKSFSALLNWIQNRWTRCFAWTFKFGFQKGIRYAPVIYNMRKQLEVFGPELTFRFRHLYQHENEVVLIGGWRHPSDGPDDLLDALPEDVFRQELQSRRMENQDLLDTLDAELGLHHH